MKIEPLRSYKPRDFALLTPGQRSLYVETKWGKQLFQGSRDVTNALHKLSDFTCYVAAGLERLKTTTSARDWVMTTWRGKGVTMTHVASGVKVTSLRGTLEGSDDPFKDLNECLAWLRQYGIPPASISSMSWKLLRASLNDTVTVVADPDVTSRAFFGGRQEILEPKTYKDMKALDLKAAYPYAMAARPVALSLRKVDNSTTIDPNQAGMAEARVFVPSNLNFPPLPIRLSEQAIQFQWGKMEGVWTWVELRAAMDLGCDVEIVNNYAPGRTADLFGTWWQMAQEGRDLPGEANRLAKAIANSTWGQFAMRPDRQTEVAWADDRGEEPFETPKIGGRRDTKYAIHVAAEVTGRVRAQTLLEGIYGTGADPAHIDTDGIIVPLSAAMPKNSGVDFGQWRVKETMTTLEVKAPQFYRFRRPQELEGWHYVAAGMNPELARKTFEKHPETSGIGYLSMADVCLPPSHAADQSYIDRLLLEAAQLGVA